MPYFPLAAEHWAKLLRGIAVSAAIWFGPTSNGGLKLTLAPHAGASPTEKPAESQVDVSF